MPLTPTPPPAHRPASVLSRTLLPYGEVFVAVALLLIVLITS